MSDHLAVRRTDRGFAHLPPIPSEYGGDVRVSESSAAMAPHVWLRVECPANLNEPDGPTVEGVAHLTVENAARLAEQVFTVIGNHYQNESTDDAAVRLWGSDCLECGNATPDSMTCDNCGRDTHTVPLWQGLKRERGTDGD